MRKLKDNSEYTHVMKMSGSKASKGVYFCLYKYKPAWNFAGEQYVKSCFVKRLYIDYNKSLELALKMVRKKHLLVLDKNPFQAPKQNQLLFVSGKYAGYSVEDVYRKDCNYIYWIGSDKKQEFFKPEIISLCIEICKGDLKPYIESCSYTFDLDKIENIVVEEFNGAKYKFTTEFIFENSKHRVYSTFDITKLCYFEAQSFSNIYKNGNWIKLLTYVS